MKQISLKSKIRTTQPLTPSELKELDSRIAANANKWLEDNMPKVETKHFERPKSTRGPKPKLITNPFYGHIGCCTDWGRYPAFALDVIEGVARLDWHNRPLGVGGKSMPLSVRNLAVILEWLPIISNETVQDLLRLQERHARRYVKAIEIILPHIMELRPLTLIHEMEGVQHVADASEWEDVNESDTPSSEAPAQLHYDLRTLTQYRTADEYEAEYEAELSGSSRSNVLSFPARTQHPKKAQAMALLEQGMGVRAIARELEVSVNSVRSWKDSLSMAQQVA